MKYEPGSIVRLRSGGPDMTIISVTTVPYEAYKCSWFDGERRYFFSDFEVTELTANDNGLGFKKKDK